MKYVPGYLDAFISPLTGKWSGNNVIPLQEDYILVGDVTNYSIASPALIDVRLDIIALRHLLARAKFLLQEARAGLDSAQDLSLVPNGMISINNGAIIQTNLTYNKFWIGDINNLPIETDTLPVGALPPLTEQHVWIGNSSNAAVEVLFNIITGTGLTGGPIVGNGTISIANTGVGAGTYGYATVNVNAQGQILTAVDNSSQISSILSDLANLASIVSALTNTVNALSSAVDAIETGIAMIGGFAAILLLQGQVIGLSIAVGAISNRVDNLEGRVATIESQITDIYNQIDILNTRIDDLRLNNIPADGDVSIYNFKLINVADPVNPQDAVNLRTLEDFVGSTTLTLIGDVSGTGMLDTPITTTLELTLDQIPLAQASVNLNNQKIINLKTDEVEEQDALNFKFLWDFMHNRIEVEWP